MADEVVTPNSAFYIRNHAPVPSSSGDDHTLAFCSFASLSSSAETPCSEPTSVRLGDLLQDLPTVHITSVMQCCGNRARDMIRESGPTAFSGTPCVVCVRACVCVCVCVCKEHSDVALSSSWVLCVPQLRGH